MMSLKNRILISFTAGLLIFLVIFAVIIFSGFNLSLKDWIRANEEKYVQEIAEKLQTAYRRGNPERDEIRLLLLPLLKENLEITVFTPDGAIIFSHNRSGITGRNELQFMNMMRNRPPGFHNQMMQGPGGGRPERLPPPPLIVPVTDEGGEIKAFVRVKSLNFSTNDRVNRQFIESLIQTSVAGTFAALIISLFSSFFISKKLTGDATLLSKGLGRLADGQRDVVFPEKGSKEIISISESASILQKELIRDEERRKQWAQDIAHDLRTPISAVKAQIEAVIDGVFTPDSSRMKKLLLELKRLELLVEDMNSLSRIESSEGTMVFSEINSSDIAGILEERFELLAEEKGINLEINSEQFVFRCDINLMIRALSNLVQNSIKYSDRNTDIDIAISKKTDKAVFYIENSGYIKENEKGKIFDRLYRGETGRTSEGTGLGLTIASAIISRHKGSIKAENRVKNGEERVGFTVEIPFQI